MNRTIHRGAIGLAAILLAMIAGELLVRPPAADLDLATDGHARLSPAATPAAPRPAWSADTLLARPLFQPGRRPEAGSAVRSLEIPGMAGLRLAGIVDGSHLKRAFFEPVHTGKAITVGEGDRLGDWTVTAIDATSVTIARGGDIRRLRPRFAAPATAAQPPPPEPMPMLAQPANSEVVGAIGIVRRPPRPLISDRP